MIPVNSLADIVLLLALGLAITPFLGRHIAHIYQSRRSPLDPILLPLERAIYRIGGVDPRRSMTWKEYFRALLLLDGSALAFVFVLLSLQSGLPWNGLHVPNMSWDLAFHTASAFTTNTDFQHYVGESQVSLFSSLFGLQTLMFLSPATGLSVFAALCRGFSARDGRIGNYYVDMVRGLTRLILPLAVVASLLFILAGAVESWSSSVTIVPFAGGSAQTIVLGPAGSWDGIEFLGTNGGGFFAANAAHPFQNPNVVTNSIAILLMMAIPMSTPIAFGRLVRRPGESWPLMATILAIFLVGLLAFLYFESANPFLGGAVSQVWGYSVGTETRFGVPDSALFQFTSVFTNTGATTMSLGALPPFAQSILLFGMFLQSTPGGDGSGFGMLLIYVVVGVFMGGLMVGRSPEYLGKKIGMPQVKWAAAALLSHPFAILIPVAVSLELGVGQAAVGGFSAHGFTVLLYEFVSESANNGSGMAPIADGTLYFNLVGAIVMLLGRYFPILAMLAIAGSLASQRATPPGPGTLKTQSYTFTIFLILFLIIVAGLLFLPVLALGPFSQVPP